MKILQFCQLYPPAVYGGGEYLFYLYAKELVKRGHEVNVITQRLNGTSDYEELDGIKVHRVGKSLDYTGHLNMSPLSNLSYIIAAVKKAQSINCDLVHSNTYAPSIAGQITSKAKSIPHVMSVFDVYSQGDFWKKWVAQRGVSKSLIFIGPLIEKLILKLRPNLFLTISKASEHDLIQAKVKAPIRIIPCCINPLEYKPIRVKPKNQFCFIGRHVFYKNVETIIKAMPSILGRVPGAKFVIVGDGPMRKDWEATARRLGVFSSVVFTGRVSNELKKRIISESKIVVQPSTIEGFGMILLESYAMGKPVLASDVAPLNELTKNTVKPYSVSSWADKIIELLKTDKKETLPEKYETRKVVLELERVLKRLIHF